MAAENVDKEKKKKKQKKATPEEEKKSREKNKRKVSFNKVMADTSATIDTAMGILKDMPDEENINVKLSTGDLSPFNLLFNLLQHIKGYDWVIRTISEYIAYAMPYLDSIIKAMLIKKLKEILSCSIDPTLDADTLMKNGVVLSPSEIDMLNKLSHSPLDKAVGANYYINSEQLKEVDDCTMSDDMDALIWYMINKANKRYTWSDRNTDKKKNTKKNKKDKKKNNVILTLEYGETSETLRNAIGEKYQAQRIINNALHVFPLDATQNDNQPTIQQFNKEDYYQKRLKKKNKKYEDEITRLKKEIAEATQAKRVEDLPRLEAQLKRIEKKQRQLQDDEGNYNPSLGEQAFVFANQNIYNPVVDKLNSIKQYGKLAKTVLQFNVEYINSLHLLDAKRVVANILTALFQNSWTINASVHSQLSVKQQMVKHEVEKLVERIIEYDDVAISDCFFTFTNDEYNDLQYMAELKHAGYTSNGNVQPVQVSAESVLAHLNDLDNENATHQNIQKVLEGAISEVSGTQNTLDLNGGNSEIKTSDNPFEWHQSNFGEGQGLWKNILNALCEAVIFAIMSPKVYLILVFNMKVANEDKGKMDIDQQLAEYRNLFKDIITSAKDNMMGFFTEKLKNALDEMKNMLADKFYREQMDYYKNLLNRCIMCFKNQQNNGGGFDFNIDKVNFADIISDGTESDIVIDENC